MFFDKIREAIMRDSSIKTVGMTKSMTLSFVKNTIGEILKMTTGRSEEAAAKIAIRAKELETVVSNWTIDDPPESHRAVFDEVIGLYKKAKVL